jgi:hypothetical protein
MANSKGDQAGNELDGFDGSELESEVLKLRLVVVMAVRLLQSAGMSKRSAVDIVSSKLSHHGLVQQPREDKADERISAATVENWVERARVYGTRLTVLTGIPVEKHLYEIALQASELSFAPFPASERELDRFLADGYLDHAIPTIRAKLT